MIMDFVNQSQHLWGAFDEISKIWRFISLSTTEYTKEDSVKQLAASEKKQ